MKISIIVPIYGVAQYVERCARSLFAQSYEECEYIFVDDCSGDGSIEIVERVVREYAHLESRTKIIRNERNMGVSASRNRGIEAATGEYLLFVDGDDWCSEEMVEQLVYEAMFTRADIISCDYYRACEGCNSVVRAPFIGGRRGSLKIVVSQSFAIANRVWGVLIKRSLLISHNLRFDTSLHFGEDYLLLVKMLYYADVVGRVAQPLYYYRADAASSVTNNFTESAKRSYIRAVREVCSFLESVEDGRRYRTSLRHARYNLRRWLLHRSVESCSDKIFSMPYRFYRLMDNTLYRAWCTLFGRY